MRTRPIQSRTRVRFSSTEAAEVIRSAPQVLRKLSRENSRIVVPAPHRPALDNWSAKGLYAAWLGHSTVLLQIDGFRILTDPVFSRKVGIEIGPLTLGLKRIVAPALDPADVGPIDLVLLSHAHMDHFDRPSLRLLENTGTTILTASQTRDLFRSPWRYRQVQELSWRQGVQVGPCHVTAFEVQHWGARVRTDTYRGYNGYLLECGRYRVVFGGDTAYTTTFRDLKGMGAAPRAIADLVIMPIGAYEPWLQYHCNPEQAWRMARDCGAEYVLPIHHQTFPLGREAYREPIERLHAAAKSKFNQICLSEIGQEFRLS